MLTHESPHPAYIRQPGGGVAPENALGALICEEGDPCAKCQRCNERFLLTVDGYHKHLLDEHGNFLFTNRDLYEGARILYDWEPVVECPNCHEPLSELAGFTYPWGETPTPTLPCGYTDDEPVY